MSAFRRNDTSQTSRFPVPEPPPPGLSVVASRWSNACAVLDEDEFRRLVEAAELYVAARSMLIGFISALGNLVQRGMNRMPPAWRDEIVARIRDSLEFVLRAAIKGLDDEPGRDPKTRLYLAGVVGTGAAGGAFGLPSVLAELPVTTGLILRSIAEIGRAHGERLDDPRFRAACIEVFAYGTPLDADEEDLAFAAARISAVEIAETVARIAVRYATSLAPKLAVASYPVIGGGLGAAVNWTYLNFYQAIARVLFTLLPLERKYDPAQIRSCFGALVRELRAGQAARKSLTGRAA